MNNQESSRNLQLPCRFLRSKEMFYQGTAEDNDQFASGVFWCTKTHENFGPDGEAVGRQECGGGRSCHVS